MKIKLEDIVFWLLIIAMIAIAFWLLSGSPPEENALITITIFVATSELLIWRKIMSMDKNTAVSFIKLRKDIDIRFLGVNNRFDNVDEKMSRIENLIIKNKAYK
ncbi:hypothetical protein HYW74_02745 [Candidatus Pacearchaeota archaeon]|nr:hypothetical protein [Candidatus Pacearchaeota archaeon]